MEDTRNELNRKQKELDNPVKHFIDIINRWKPNEYFY